MITSGEHDGKPFKIFRCPLNINVTFKSSNCFLLLLDIEKNSSIFLHIQWWPPAPAPVKNLNISFKCCSNCKSRDSFGFCSSWGFQNTPNMLKLIEFWLRYLRSKTNDRILKISSKLIKIDENLMKSTHFVSKVINSTSKTSHWLLKNDSHWHWCPQK